MASCSFNDDVNYFLTDRRIGHKRFVFTQVPVVSINAPATGASFFIGDTISFSGTATDVEDGDVSSGIVWTSSLDGTIGTGSGFSISTLSAGIHSITASDSAVQTGTDAITVAVQAPGGSGAAGGLAVQAPTNGQPRLEYQANFT